MLVALATYRKRINWPKNWISFTVVDGSAEMGHSVCTVVLKPLKISIATRRARLKLA